LKTIRNWTLALVLIVLIVGVVGAAVYLTRRTVAPSFSIAPSTLVAPQGANITFSVYGLESDGNATIYFGDGHEASTTSTLTYAYQNPGRYLVGAEEFINGQSVASTFNALQTIQITAQVNASLAPSISVPVVAFDVDRNPSAPVVKVGDQVYLYGGFVRQPSGTNVTISRYDWDFGNGAAESVDANQTSLNPVDNPATVSYAQSGLYPVTLSLITENSSMASFKTSVEQTVAVGSSSQPYSLFLYAGVVPDPTVINVAENWGPPCTLDPDLDLEDNGYEIQANIFSTLLVYNGSSTTNFIPMAASEVPSLSNGGISSNFTSYTFQIRPGLRFSNGDPLTAYDVYYSMVRDLLFRGSYGTGYCGVPGFILAQYLIVRWPGYFLPSLSLVQNATDTAGYNSIVNSMAYSNASNTITFKMRKPFSAELLFSALADAQGGAILDSRWLERVGAGITFTPAGFYAYENEGNQGNFNLQVQNDPVGSGPYVIQSYVLGQSISLAPNPEFQSVPGNPGIPKPNDTIVIQWIKYPETAYELFRSGQADIVPNLPPEYFPQVKQLVASGQAKLYQYPTLMQHNLWGRIPGFNGGFYETDMQNYFGSQFQMPATYFLNLDVRKAWAYAFNYNYFLDEILGNKKYGIDYGNGYAGVIIQGLPFYVPESELQNVPYYNLTYAKQLLQESGEYNVTVNIPWPVYPCYVCGGMDNQTKWAMGQMYGADLHSIDPNIVITPIVDNGTAPGDAYPIGGWNGGYSWSSNYPYPSDAVNVLYEGDTMPYYFNSTGYPEQAAMFAQMNALIWEADSTTNMTLAAQDYKQIEQIGINLYLWIYTFQQNELLVTKPYVNGYQGQMSYIMNPILGTEETAQYVWLVKTCGSTQACSGRGIGP